MRDGDIFAPHIENWENALDVAGCRIPPFDKISIKEQCPRLRKI